MIIRLHAENGHGNRTTRKRTDQRWNDQIHTNVLGHFLKGKHRSAKRRRKRHTQAGAGRSDREKTQLFRRKFQPSAKGRSKSSSHLNGRTFTSESHTAAKCQQAADKLHKHDTKSCRLHFLTPCRFNILNTAAACGRGKSYQSPANHSCSDTDQENETEPFKKSDLMRPCG